MKSITGRIQKLEELMSIGNEREMPEMVIFVPEHIHEYRTVVKDRLHPNVD